MKNLFFLICFLFSLSCQKTTISTLPQGITTSVSEITTSHVLVTGELESDGGVPLEEYGVCWGLNNNPTIYNNKIRVLTELTKADNSASSSKSILGKFSQEINGFPETKTYYFRVYARNKNGIIYGNVVSVILLTPNPIQFNSLINYGFVIDNEGYSYKTVKIGDQTWMAENLKTKHFNNGDLIPNTMFKIYEDLEMNTTIYGRSYNYSAFEDLRGICPIGWHLPSKDEWQTLINYANNKTINLKESGNFHWISSDGNNVTGFTAIPSGYLLGSGSLLNIGKSSDYWTSTKDMDKIFDVEIGDNFTFFSDTKDSFFSIRCVKD